MTDQTTFTREEIDLFRQWYNAVCDVSPKYLLPSDHALGRKVTEAVGMKWYAPRDRENA